MDGRRKILADGTVAGLRVVGFEGYASAERTPAVKNPLLLTEDNRIARVESVHEGVAVCAFSTPIDPAAIRGEHRLFSAQGVARRVRPEHVVLCVGYTEEDQKWIEAGLDARRPSQDVRAFLAAARDATPGADWLRVEGDDRGRAFLGWLCDDAAVRESREVLRAAALAKLEDAALRGDRWAAGEAAWWLQRSSPLARDIELVAAALDFARDPNGERVLASYMPSKSDGEVRDALSRGQQSFEELVRRARLVRAEESKELPAQSYNEALRRLRGSSVVGGLRAAESGGDALTARAAMRGPATLRVIKGGQ